MICIFSITAVSASDLNATDDVIANELTIQNSNDFLEDESINNLNSGILSDNINRNITLSSKVDESVVESNNQIIYISPSGTGDGSSQTNPTTWNSAYNAIGNGGTIGFLPGTYTNIYSKTISKQISLKGIDEGVVLDAQNKGRFFVISADNVVIDNIKFVNGFLENGKGGAIYWSNSNGVLTNCEFYFNHAYDHLTFDPNFAFGIESIEQDDNTGGAVCWNGLNGVICNCTFESNHVDDLPSRYYRGNYYLLNAPNSDAGALVILNNGKNTTVDSCKFNKNTVTVGDNAGGAVVITSGATNCKFLNTVFTNNKANWDGAFTVYSSNNEFINCTFINNTANENTGYFGGGAIHFYTDAHNQKISDCTFINNVVKTHDGGAIYSQNSNNVVIENTIFKDNRAGASGGAVFLPGTSSLTNCTFINNRCNNGCGGAVYLAGTKSSVKNCSFSSNNAYGSGSHIGGAIYIAGTYSNITDSSFDSNYVRNGDNDGGAISIMGSYVTIDKCNFNNNNAIIDSLNDGGAVDVYSQNCKIKNSNFTNNQAGWDGALTLASVNNEVLNCTFINNTSIYSHGGAIKCAANNQKIVNCTFISNSAKTDGGAIFLTGSSKSVIEYCYFNGNSANGYGGTIRMASGNELLLNNCTFENTPNNDNSFLSFYNDDSYTVADCVMDTTPNGVNYYYNTFLNVNNVSIVQGEDCILNAHLSYVKGSLTGKTVIFTVNGKQYSKTTTSNGVATLNVKDYLPDLGAYEVTVSYGGEGVISPISKTVNILVNNYKGTLTVSQQGKYYGDKSISFKLVNSKTGTAISNAPINVIFSNGANINIYTDSNGVATYNMSSFVPGNYKIDAHVTSPNVDVNVVKLDDISVSKISGIIELSKSNSNKTLNIKLINPSNGDVYKNINVKLQFNPNGYETTVITGSDGVATYPMLFGIGTYNVIASVDSFGYKEFADAELDNIVISTVGKDDSAIDFDKKTIVFDFGKSGYTTLTRIEGCNVYRENVKVLGQEGTAIINVANNRITVSGLAAGTYTLRVTTTPDEYHNSVTRDIGITVNKVDSSITLPSVSGNYGSSITISPSGIVGCDISYDVVSVVGQNPRIDVINNKITISGLPAGTHTLKVSTIPKSSYKSVTKTATITVNRIDSVIGFTTPISFVYGTVGKIPLTLEGCSVVREGCSIANYNTADISVSGNVVSVSKLPVGSYTLIVSSVPDSNHNSVTRNVVFSVTKADSNVDISVKPLTFDYGAIGSSDLILTGCSVLSDDITVVGHVEAITQSISNRVYVSNLSAGSYTLQIKTHPDANHNSVTKTFDVAVRKPLSSVSFSNPIVFDYLGEGTTTLILDGCSVDLDNVIVVDYDEAVIGKNNKGVITLSNLTAGKYTLRVESTPDENHRSAVATLPVTVNKLDSDIVFIKDSISFKYSKSGSTPIVLDNCKVASMSIEGQSVKPVLKGNVISVSGLPVGNYRLKVTTQPVNGNYNSVVRSIPVVVSKNTAKITVKKQTFAYKKAGKWAITLKDSTGKAISKVKVTLKVYTGKNAKAYASTATNSKGVAYFNKIKELTLGNHKVVVSFSHRGYKCKAVSSSIKVIKQTPVKFKIVPNTTPKGFSVSVIVKDKSGKKFVNGVKVKLTVGSGKNMRSITLVSANYAKGKGVCAYSTNMLPAGTHKVTVTSAVVNYAGSASSKVTLKASAKKVGPWWEKVSNGKLSSHGLK